MNVENKSKRLICLQTTKGRVDLLPGQVTEDDRIDLVKNEEVFKALVKAGDLAEAKGERGAKRTPKELLLEEAIELGIDTTDMTSPDLKDAIAEAKGEGE